jgi:REP element-mobilizing transposase RayT
MVRGIERTTLFRDDADRNDFVARVAAFAAAGAWSVYAWALLPNHAHLLVRTGHRPLPRSMRSLLTGYAGAFNRRHQRVGHLFQNRYKSIVVEEEVYLLELVRYLHLNPLRAKVVPDGRRLDRFPWTGHSALCGTVPRPWQDTATILAQFGPRAPRARRAYRAFIAAGRLQGRRPELQGGGLLRSLGGWQAVAALRRGREAYRGDERILGRAAFVAQLQQQVAPAAPVRGSRLTLAALTARVCRQVGLGPAGLRGGGRHGAVARGRVARARWERLLKADA